VVDGAVSGSSTCGRPASFLVVPVSAPSKGPDSGSGEPLGWAAPARGYLKAGEDDGRFLRGA
jgi:hypothetical protein